MSYSLLFVDDEEDILDIFQDIADDDDDISPFFGAGSAEAALEILAENVVDVIISDQNMPGISGIELLDKVVSLTKEKNVPMPLFYLSTGDSDFTNESIIEKGGTGVVIKPFDIIDVLDKITAKISSK